mmetsp:Transcript_126576/g.319695  ORF Transcript_126576/g.319695 Transcript_126576/m.319695 type:complete len:243 (+) Transcript_126576:374-1102(+)
MPRSNLGDDTVVPRARCFGCLCRLWKRDTATGFKHDGFVFLGDGGVHHGAVAVTIHMLITALLGTAPCHAADLFARKRPIRKTMEPLPEPGDLAWRGQVHEGVAQASLRLEVDWKIDEVVLACEPFRVQHCEQHVTGVVVRQISEHHRRPFLNTHQRHLFGLCCFFGAGLTLRASNTLLLVLLPLRLTITRKFTVPLGVESILHVTEAPTITRSRRARCTNHHVWASLIPCRDMPRAWRNTL